MQRAEEGRAEEGEPRETPAAAQGASQSLRVMFRAMVVLQHLFAVMPFLALGALYAASWRASALIGRWPVPWVDDPKFIWEGDWLYGALYPSVVISVMGVAVAMLALPLITGSLLWWRRYPSGRGYPLWWSAVLLVLYAVGFLLLRLDPGDRLKWYVD